ncbi:ATP-binding cassette domain-containing protein [Actinomadura scrupuli]|uniref:ATP-binding cassette domain-containing protein n=1 Tax=Actinomadura scrupuli TaxID=559629 RepID=UPI003D9923D4
MTPEPSETPDASDIPGEPGSRGAAVEATGLSLKAARGWVYRDVDLSVSPGRLVALAGEAGTGRTALLLTLGGRMRPTAGRARIGGHELPAEMRAVQRIAALGVIGGVNDLEPTLTVREQAGEALDLHLGLFGPLRPKARRARITAALARVGLDLDLGLAVHELPPDETQLLGAALALLGEPRLLLLDEVDARLTPDRQHALWQRLHAIAGSGVTVIATCHDPAPAAGLAETVQIPPHREGPSDG